jgi:hypothetical protein
MKRGYIKYIALKATASCVLKKYAFLFVFLCDRKVITRPSAILQYGVIIWPAFKLPGGWDDRLCGLVVRALDYRSGGPGSIRSTTTKKR